MTLDAEPTAAASPGVLTRGRGFLGVLAILIAVIAVCAWISLGVGLYLDVERQTRFILAMVAALATEGLFWIVAAWLGVSVFEARLRIWRRLTGQKA
ncbi:hypothetical protein [Brevundimonas sp.]|uniref:hypothetical protein n=1 Tax=Brevundimonas sp. TaxID=1871086 RepID=UPI003D101EB4